MSNRPIHREKEAGFTAVFVLIVLVIAMLFTLGFFFIFFIIPRGVAELSRDGKGGPGEIGAIKDAGGNPDGTPSDIDDEESSDGSLVCVNLPGVGQPRTPALDRRVARRLLAVRQELDARGISITFTWGFRTTCQQRLVQSGGNLKAKPGTSPHEAGRAVDVNGMKTRPDRFIIIDAFQRAGWVWLGAKDPPHFDIKGYTVGEPSHAAWIRRMQEDFRRGNPVGCRGTECGQ